MVERKTPGEIILLVFIYAAVTLVGFVCLYPMLYCLAASFSDPMKLLTHSGALFFSNRLFAARLSGGYE